jgi:hypothetical protein
MAGKKWSRRFVGSSSRAARSTRSSSHRNFSDHREHIDGDFALAVLALLVAFFGSHLVARRKRREWLRPSGGASHFRNGNAPS